MAATIATPTASSFPDFEQRPDQRPFVMVIDPPAAKADQCREYHRPTKERQSPMASSGALRLAKKGRLTPGNAPNARPVLHERRPARLRLFCASMTSPSWQDGAAIWSRSSMIAFQASRPLCRTILDECPIPVCDSSHI